VALVVAQRVPTSSTMAVPHGPAGVGTARRRLRADLLASGASETVVDDAVLILSELLSNACRHARPLHPEDQSVRTSWSSDGDGELTISVTDGGGPTRPLPAKPSITARGGRGLAIIGALARDWGVREEMCELPGGAGSEASDTRRVTVWVVLSGHSGFGDGLADTLGLDLAAVEELR
jgi:anti-sigma regulatory factor (Ser/Thr protein kinase)